jgi:Family of unknown function (DUF6049)
MFTAARSRWRAHTCPQVVLVLFGVLLLACSWVLTASSPAAANSAAGTVAAADSPEAVDPVAVRLVSLSPEVIRPGDTFTVEAEIENTSDQQIESPVVTLSIVKRIYDTRSTLASWADASTQDSLGTTLSSIDLPMTLAAGATTRVTFTVDADSMDLTQGDFGWGPRGIAISVTSGSDMEYGIGTLGALRTYLLWYPVADDDVTPVSVSVVVPVVGPTYDPLNPTASLAALDDATATQGRLGSLLAATGSVPGVTWAVDPALVTTAASAVTPTPTDAPSDGATTDPSTIPPAKVAAELSVASSWASSLLTAAEGREVFALPEYDQDVTAYAADGQAPLAQQTLPAELSTWRTDLAWPEENEPSLETLTYAAASGTPNVLVWPGSLQPTPELTYTASGRGTIATDSGEVTALIPDQGLSQQLTEPTDTTPAAARQRLLAELAVIARERPAEARQLLITVPRDWSPSAEIAAEQLSSLNETPWTSLQPLSALIGAEDPAIPRAGLVSTASTEDAITTRTIEQLREHSSTVATIATIVPDPAQVTAPADEAVLAAGSVAWRADPQGREAAVAELASYSDQLRASIAWINGSDFTLISSGSDIPISVSNDLDQDVTVKIALVPDDPRLVVETSDAVLIPAGTSIQEMIAVRGVGSGSVSVRVQILSADGSLITDVGAFNVRVHADWETRGTAVLAGLLVILLGFGIWRTIHRGRSDRRTSAEEVEILDQLEAEEAGTQRDGAS